MAEDSKSDRVKFVYNAQFPSSTAVVLDYLINNDAFTSRQGRQRAMDAITAFYRPLAEEERGKMSEEQVQAVAGVCVEQLVKQIDTLCDRYQLPNPITSRARTASISGDRLESILESGFQTIADAIRGSGLSVDSPLPMSPPLEQGVLMDGSELGDLDDVDFGAPEVDDVVS
ncbi:hypothetical protein [Leptothoe spongobia]|uniref:Uncharacterized protein n=1 Tax=Leptothoe spongobia TAU-MAC 1115 TaxID=1967444 RepID=A0A947GKS4_9CYAN|nr:hypothetical protein [Leptothoe spongobia]MBT9317890.1 hypothetical protein [Leptothoe spongobia TAU-MAC 1115]